MVSAAYSRYFPPWIVEVLRSNKFLIFFASKYFKYKKWLNCANLFTIACTTWRFCKQSGKVKNVRYLIFWLLAIEPKLGTDSLISYCKVWQTDCEQCTLFSTFIRRQRDWWKWWRNEHRPLSTPMRVFSFLLRQKYETMFQFVHTKQFAILLYNSGNLDIEYNV